MCSFVDEYSSFGPFINFHHLSHNGTTAQVKNTKPPMSPTTYQIAFQKEKAPFEGNFIQYTRKLSLRDIHADATKTYFCLVNIVFDGSCQTMKRLQVRTRMYEYCLAKRIVQFSYFNVFFIAI